MHGQKFGQFGPVRLRTPPKGMRSQRKGLAQFFGGIRAEKCIESIAENLCLTLLKQGRPSNRVNGYSERQQVQPAFDHAVWTVVRYVYGY